MGSRWLARHAIADRVNGALEGARGRACAARMKALRSRLRCVSYLKHSLYTFLFVKMQVRALRYS